MLLLVAVGLYRGWYVPSGTGPLSARGRLEATEVAISSEVTARILDIAVDERQAVRAGDVLVRLDDSLPQVQYRHGAAADQQLKRSPLAVRQRPLPRDSAELASVGSGRGS